MKIDMKEMEQMSYKWCALSQQRLHIEDICESMGLEICLDSFENKLRLRDFCVIAMNATLRMRFDVRIAADDEIENLVNDASFSKASDEEMCLNAEEGISYTKLWVNENTCRWVRTETTAFEFTGEEAA